LAVVRRLLKSALDGRRCLRPTSRRQAQYSEQSNPFHNRSPNTYVALY
jgi:hypothetical protein